MRKLNINRACNIIYPATIPLKDWMSRPEHIGKTEAECQAYIWGNLDAIKANNVEIDTTNMMAEINTACGGRSNSATTTVFNRLRAQSAFNKLTRQF